MGSTPPADHAYGHSNLSSIFQPLRTLKVICIGAGASGLLVAYNLQRHFDDFSLTIYEKNSDVGGTWFENRYPGCACDVPSHNYTWSFEPKTDWSANYASWHEIFKYFKDFSDKYELDKYIQFNHEVVDARWDEVAGEWTVQARETETNELKSASAHVVINAGGILNAWRYPPIAGIHSYKGTLVHSAAWPEGLDLRGKTVGLIGNGSSGIQILPAIKNEVKELITFIREATWVAPPLGEEYHAYSEKEQEEFAKDANHHLSMRKQWENKASGGFNIFHTGSALQKQTRAYMLDLMKSKLKHPALEKVLIPEWSVGCRRITPGTNYLESLNNDNVKVVFGEITQITETGVITNNGEGEYPVDVLICATGFDTSFKPRFSLVGSTGEQLSTLWKDEPRAYLGIAVDKFPNYFFTLGPNCPIGNGPVLVSIEAEVSYIIKMLSKFQKENLHSFDVRPEAVRDFNDWKDRYMQETSEWNPFVCHANIVPSGRCVQPVHLSLFPEDLNTSWPQMNHSNPVHVLVWTEACRSWYKAGSASGKILALWPGSTLHYLETLNKPRWEDWLFKYKSENRFAYLGNGHSSAEAYGGDLSYYIRNKDDSPVDPILKRP